MKKRKLFTKTPLLFKLLYPTLIWNLSREKKKLYLTFDDGPTPEVSEKVMEILAHYKAKATFFCVGQQVEKHPEIFNKIQELNHSIGNHSYSHKKGWDTNTNDYILDVRKASKLISTNIFRPPYGKISRQQIAVLKNDFKIVMWDVLSYDYDKLVSPQQCAHNVIRNARNGSIVVFHDSQKAKENVLLALPIVLEHFQKLGYQFSCF
jgi:peptidoglycan/xylan/chitin deacetylase (PgdA/CDA1 family)